MSTLLEKIAKVTADKAAKEAEQEREAQEQRIAYEKEQTAYHDTLREVARQLKGVNGFTLKELPNVFRVGNPVAALSRKKRIIGYFRILWDSRTIYRNCEPEGSSTSYYYSLTVGTDTPKDDYSNVLASSDVKYGIGAFESELANAIVKLTAT